MDKPSIETKCRICGKVFYNYYDNEKHRYTRKTICDDCNIENKDTKTLVCQKCGKEFKVGRSPTTGRFYIRLFCPECSQPEKTKTLICQKCGKEFKVGRVDWGGFSNKKYCPDCSNIKETKTLICQKCGKPFEVERRLDNKGYKEVKYCPDCDITNKSTKIVICKKCGKPFEVNRYKNTNKFKEQKYCNSCMLENDYVKCKRCGKIFKKKPTYEKQTDIYCSSCRKEVWHEKAEQTCLELYGVRYPCLREECLKSKGQAISKINLKFADFLKENNINFELEKVIKSYSYDFCLPENNILIELNPTYTHSVLGNHWNNWKYDKTFEDYHVNKTNLALANNYRCIHIWQWDDWNKIIQLLKPKQKLYARKLQLKEITKQEANSFLNQYHLQNSCYGNSVSLGLFNKEQLVQVMTFGKPRYNKNYQWELLRLCSHSDYKIIGGSERLFKYFIRNYNPESIISYCDTSKFTGDVYERLGFKLKQITPPAKIWSENNYNFGVNSHITDNLLRQRGFDQLFGTSYGKGTNNEELMIKHKFMPIYDCGQKIFVKEGDKNE